MKYGKRSSKEKEREKVAANIHIIVTVYGKTNLIPQILILQYRAKHVCNRYLVDFEFKP